MSEVDHVPTEFGSLIMQLIVPDVSTAVDFYKAAFGANELYRNVQEGDDRVFYCELLIGDARLFLHDEFPERGLPSPQRLGGSPVTLHLFVEDAASVVAAAIASGAEEISPVKPRYWGAIVGVVNDPFGHRWVISTQTEDIGPKEVMRRAKDRPLDERLPRGLSRHEV